MRWKSTVLLAIPVLAVAALLYWGLHRPGTGHGSRSAPASAAHEDRPPEPVVEDRQDSSRPLPVESPLPDPVAFVTGVVTGPDGNPVNRAEVTRLKPGDRETVYADRKGGYRLPVYRLGSQVVEAQRSVDLAPRRKTIDVMQAEVRLDFRLAMAGYLHGIVLSGEQPVDGALVDVYQGDKWVLDSESEGGLFTFADEPPHDVPLELRIHSKDGVLDPPRSFVYRGKPIDFGDLSLEAYGRLHFRLRLPDGSLAKDAYAASATALRPEYWANGYLLRTGIPASPFDSGVLYLEDPTKTLERFVIFDKNKEFCIFRSVELAPMQVAEQDFSVAPGPVEVRGHAVDAQGEGLRIRFRYRDQDVVESGPDGAFATELPHGGVFTFRVTGWFVPGSGWVPVLDPAPFLFDADDKTGTFRLDLDRRVLVLGNPPAPIELEGGGSRASFWTRGDHAPCGYLSPAMKGAACRWTRGVLVKRKDAYGRTYQIWDFPKDKAAWFPFSLEAHGLTLLDTR